MKGTVICRLKEVLKYYDRYNISGAAIIFVAPQPYSTYLLDAPMHVPIEITIYTVADDTVIDVKKKNTALMDFEKLLAALLHDPDPLDDEFVILLLEIEYCRFKEILVANTMESQDAARQAASKAIRDIILALKQQ